MLKNLLLVLAGMGLMILMRNSLMEDMKFEKEHPCISYHIEKRKTFNMILFPLLREYEIEVCDKRK